MSEMIKCPAVSWVNDGETITVSGTSTVDAILAANRQYGVDRHRKLGYMTTEDRFVDAFEAYRIAADSHQLRQPTMTALDHPSLKDYNCNYATEGTINE